MKFKSEQELFETAIESPDLKKIVRQRYPQTLYLIEPKGLFGIPDLVIANLDQSDNSRKRMRSFAFEMKLRNWKRALTQAYRYRSFSYYSYVMLDNSYIEPALKNIELFKRSNIGLLGIDVTGAIKIYHKPLLTMPYEKSMFRLLKDNLFEEFPDTYGEAIFPHPKLINSPA